MPSTRGILTSKGERAWNLPETAAEPVFSSLVRRPFFPCLSSPLCPQPLHPALRSSCESLGGITDEVMSQCHPRPPAQQLAPHPGHLPCHSEPAAGRPRSGAVSPRLQVRVLLPPPLQTCQQGSVPGRNSSGRVMTAKWLLNGE